MLELGLVLMLKRKSVMVLTQKTRVEKTVVGLGLEKKKKRSADFSASQTSLFLVCFGPWGGVVV